MSRHYERMVVIYSVAGLLDFHAPFAASTGYESKRVSPFLQCFNGPVQAHEVADP